MKRELQKEEFKTFMEKCTKSPGSFRNYFSGFSKLEDYIKDIEPKFTSLLDYDEPEYIQSIYNKLMQNKDFTEYDTSKLAKKMYSNTLLYI